MTYEERIQKEYNHWEGENTVNDIYVSDAILIEKRTVSSQAEAIKECMWFNYLRLGLTNPGQQIESYLITNGYKPLNATGSVTGE
jgi:hypothetical protein